MSALFPVGRFILRRFSQRSSLRRKSGLTAGTGIALTRPRVLPGLYHVTALPRSLCSWPTDFPQTTEWGYMKDDGPSKWPAKYPDAGGFSQSPINIQTPTARASTELKERPLSWSYPSQVCKSVSNTGCGWRVDVEGGDEPGLSGGPLQNHYELVQFHCHWGDCPSHGSEHTIDGKAYVGELHFVHWNKELYPNCAEAARAPKGLVVLAVFLELGEPNPEIEKLCELLKKVPFRGQTTEIPADFDPTYLFPDDQSYWTYEGSLTTPPCYESVTWIVFKRPVTVTDVQLRCFRSMCSYNEDEEAPDGNFNGRVLLNFRPPQELNARIVRECSYS